MSAPARLDAAFRSPASRTTTAGLRPGTGDSPRSGAGNSLRLWQEAVDIRQEWLGHALRTDPADRPTAERALSRIYARIGRPVPRFHWVDSPHAALPYLDGLPTIDDLYQVIRRPGSVSPPLASDLAMAASGLRGALSASVDRGDPELAPARPPKSKEPWPKLPPRDALAAGTPLNVVLHRSVHGALHRSVATGFRQPIHAALAPGGSLPVCWYGQHDVPWIGYYDMLRRVGLARYQPGPLAQFADWADLARSCGWWWPGERVCVLTERPETLRTEPIPGAWHDEVRLRPGGVAYRDGWHPLVR
jgi:hypothetical protein